MKRTIAAITMICFFALTTGCGHLLFPPSQKVDPYTPYDKELSCDEMGKEICDLKEKEKNEMTPGAQAGLNTLNFVAGCFTLINWFLIDFSTTRGEVIASFEKRWGYLERLCKEKDCPPYTPTPEIVATAEKRSENKFGEHSK